MVSTTGSASSFRILSTGLPTSPTFPRRRPDPDAQEVVGPDGVEVRWIVREDRHARPGEAALAELRGFTPVRPETILAFLVGEQRLAAEGRRHLVACGVAKARIEFSGFWRVGRAAD
ncbi:hypothetical protein BW733_15165 [Tessaracoccus flavescens]|uniref:SIP-like Rossmann fold domain-containing protein n=1 Tax=Tessaracoccus flavescens TaxID=399497 RepID=A0A1Q2D107_9ACTN|nr:hypothetical protein BW733_15165 [Tessaracoccus flavescens]